MEILLTLLYFVVFAQSKECNYYIEGFQYEQETIYEIQGIPTNLAYNSKTDDLFFTLIDIESLIDDEMETKMDQYVLNNGTALRIDNFNGQATAIDKNGKVYFGSDKGLYVYDELTKKAVPYGFENDDIVQLFIPEKSDDFYVILYPDNEVYILSRDGSKTLVEGIRNANYFAVDSANNIFYGTESGHVNVLLKGFKEPIRFVGIKSESGRVLNTYFSTSNVVLANTDGLYKLKPDNVVPSKIAEFDFVPSGIALGSDVYVSTSGKIMKYSHSRC